MATTYVERSIKMRIIQASLIPVEWRLSDIPSEVDAPNAVEFIHQAGLPTTEELTITETLNVPELLGKLSNGELSSLKVTRAFEKRAAITQQLSNCLTEIFFDEAFARASELDGYSKSTGKTFEPLHGLSISPKDNFNLKGYESTIGWMALIDQPAMEHSSRTIAKERPWIALAF